MSKIFKTGDPCPCCGKPIPLQDPEALQILSMMADMLGLTVDPIEDVLSEEVNPCEDCPDQYYCESVCPQKKAWAASSRC